MRNTITITLCAVAMLCMTAACGNNNRQTKRGMLSQTSYTRIEDGEIINVDKSDFDEIETDSVTRVPVDLVINNSEIDLIAKDGYLIIKSLTRYAGSHLITIIDEKSLEPKGEAAAFGAGPDEFNDARLIRTEEDGVLCYILNPRNNKLYRLAEDLKMKYLGELPKPKNLEHFSMGYDEGMTMANSGKLITKQRADDGEGICILSLSDSTFQGLAALDFSSDLDSFWAMYGGYMTYDPKSETIIFAMSNFERILYIDLKRNSIKTIQNGEPKSLNTKTRSEFFETGENITYYTGVTNDSKYVYASYRGEKAYAPNIEPDLHYYIEQYDMEGKPIKRYKLPKGNVYRIMSPTGTPGEFYLINKGEDDFLYKVKLPEEG